MVDRASGGEGMTTATLTRRKATRKATRTKRGRPAADDYPMPFRELPLRLQDAAIESFRNSNNCYDEQNNEFIQDNLGEVLEYEFGITPEYETYKDKDGKNHKGSPKIYWDQYNYVEFEVDDFSIDEVLKHGGDEDALDKEHGTCYFKPEARELLVLMAQVVIMEASLGVEFDADYRLKTDTRHDVYSHVTWQWDREDGPKYYPIETPGSAEYQAADKLFGRIEEALKDYYEAACSRLRKCIEDEEKWRFSDECVRETLENNDHWEFDDEGSCV